MTNITSFTQRTCVKGHETKKRNKKASKFEKTTNENFKLQRSNFVRSFFTYKVFITRYNVVSIAIEDCC
uniref:Uncharacterized protein n=1 Tax=Meloidogyne enterolobii TaxID=390850 RepID=A0A6V7W6C2_MELEN|nr:unnamed protein product [Meloidogyne enterolobii]CAD2185726.1 unnamed protein product [Meloidogyne enterolobii]